MKYLISFKESKLTKFIRSVKKAKEFASDAHAGTFRKSVGDDGDKVPYIIHPDIVARIVHEVKDSKQIADLIIAAYLHDTVEDTDITIEDIRGKFGDLVASLVSELTSDEEKIKLVGKEKYLIDKLLNMSSWALVIKLADRLHNLSDFEKILSGTDQKRKRWVKEYAKETRNIIDELDYGRDLSKTQRVLVDRINKMLDLVL